MAVNFEINSSEDYLSRKLENFYNEVTNIYGYLHNRMGFMEKTVLKISRPIGIEIKIKVYIGIKREQELKFPAIKTSNGMFLNFFRPLKERYHDLML